MRQGRNSRGMGAEMGGEGREGWDLHDWQMDLALLE